MPGTRSFLNVAKRRVAGLPYDVAVPAAAQRARYSHDWLFKAVDYRSPSDEISHREITLAASETHSLITAPVERERNVQKMKKRKSCAFPVATPAAFRSVLFFKFSCCLLFSPLRQALFHNVIAFVLDKITGQFVYALLSTLIFAKCKEVPGPERINNA